MDTTVDITPVDYVSQAIFHLSIQEESPGKAFHLLNPHSLHWSELIHWVRTLGYPLQPVPYDQWQAKLINYLRHSADNALYPLWSLFYKILSDRQAFPEQELSPLRPPQYDCRNTIEGLKATSIVCPPPDARLLGVYFSYLTQSGFLDPPQQRK